jgi:hypothetical protein
VITSRLFARLCEWASRDTFIPEGSVGPTGTRSELQKIYARSKSALLAASVAIAAVFVGLTPGVANAQTQEVMPASVTVPLTFTGFDAAVAAKNGYELRTDTTGRQYITKITTPAGSISGAHYLPRNVDASGSVLPTTTKLGVASPNGVVTGDCGNSSIFFESTHQYQTSYTFTEPGGTYEHVWYVTGTSSLGSQTYDDSGYAPYGGVGWVSGLKTMSQPGYVTYIIVSTGYAIGALGYICGSGAPSAVRN